MTNRQLIQLRPESTPFGHESIHQRDEAGVVRWLQQVNHFMHDDVFQAFAGFLRQIGIQSELHVPGLQLPHFVFIFCTKTRFTFTPIIGSHFAINWEQPP